MTEREFLEKLCRYLADEGLKCEDQAKLALFSASKVSMEGDARYYAGMRQQARNTHAMVHSFIKAE